MFNSFIQIFKKCFYNAYNFFSDFGPCHAPLSPLPNCWCVLVQSCLCDIGFVFNYYYLTKQQYKLLVTNTHSPGLFICVCERVVDFVNAKDEGAASEFVRVLYIRGMLPLQTQLDHLPLIVAFLFSMKPYSRNNSIRSCWVLFVYFLLCEV